MGWQNGQIHCRFCTNKSDVNNQIWNQPKCLKKDSDKIFNPRCGIEKNKENSLRSDEGKSDWEQSKETLLEVRFYLKGY